jgi:hypothetical protein
MITRADTQQSRSEQLADLERRVDVELRSSGGEQVRVSVPKCIDRRDLDALAGRYRQNGFEAGHSQGGVDDPDRYFWAFERLT